MSRLPRYIDSLNKFVKDRSMLHKYGKTALISEVCKSEVILSILFLTIMNSQNKKKNISAQGYYISTSILLMNTIVQFLEVRDITKFNTHILDSILCINKSLAQNLDNTKHLISASDISSILSSFNNYICYDNLLEIPNIKPHTDGTYLGDDSDIKKYYISCHSNSEILLEKYSHLLKLDHDNFMAYIDKKYGQLSEITFGTSWIIGCGEASQLGKVKRLSKVFSIVYKLFIDFCNIDRDLMLASEINNKSINYVINFGIKKATEDFLLYKQKFIEGCMINGIFGTTIREIINHIDNKVDSVIDNTNPDLKSNFTPSHASTN